MSSQGRITNFLNYIKSYIEIYKNLNDQQFGKSPLQILLVN